MARPRRPFSGMGQIAPKADVWSSDEAASPLGVRRERRWSASRHWSYPHKAGYQDPMAVMFVLDALLGIDPQVELRAAALSRYLNGQELSLSFDPVTTGRILADLHDGFAEVHGEKHGLLLRGRDWQGTFYVLNHNQDTIRTAWAVRDYLYGVTQAEIGVRRSGGKTDFMGSPLNECPVLRGEWEGLADEAE